MYKEGIYDFMGNTVRYEDGIAFDLDANEEIPEEALELADYVGPLED